MSLSGKKFLINVLLWHYSLKIVLWSNFFFLKNVFDIILNFKKKKSLNEIVFGYDIEECTFHIK